MTELLFSFRSELHFYHISYECGANSDMNNVITIIMYCIKNIDIYIVRPTYDEIAENTFVPQYEYLWLSILLGYFGPNLG